MEPKDTDLRKTNHAEGLLVPIQRAVEKLFHWQNLGCDDFTSQLYRLMSKANQLSFEKLAVAFPNEAYAFTQWRESLDARKFFSRHGLGV